MREVDGEARRQFWLAAGPDLIRQEAERMFGEPNRSHSTMKELRFGKRGSVSVGLVGDKAGAWFDHETGKGGLLPIPDADFRAMIGGGQPSARSRPAALLQRPAAVPHDGEADAQRQAEGIARAKQIWRETVPLQDTLGERYLRDIRRRDPTGIVDLRFHPNLWFEGQTLPALIGCLRNFQIGRVTGVHQTFFDRESGEKVGRRMRGVAAGAGIMLDPFDAPVYGLAICEGVEDGLAARGIFRPVWVLTSAGAMAKFPVLPGIETLTIFADADAARQRAAAECAQRWAAAGREVIIRMPVGVKDIDEVTR